MASNEFKGLEIEGV